MVFNTGAALLDAIVLAVVSKEAEGTYGYKITQDVRQAIEISESTLYPILRRLEVAGKVKSYSTEYNNRIRKYFSITQAGKKALEDFEQDRVALMKVLDFISGGKVNE